MKHAFVAFLLIIAMQPAMAASPCPDVSRTSPTYRSAVRRVVALAEVKAWENYVAAHPPARVAFDVEQAARQVLVGRECYVVVTLYSDEVTHLHRWNTFNVGSRSGRILVKDLENVPTPLAAWRSKSGLK
jgi:hypothetical protein